MLVYRFKAFDNSEKQDKEGDYIYSTKFDLKIFWHLHVLLVVNERIMFCFCTFGVTGEHFVKLSMQKLIKRLIGCYGCMGP